MAQNEVPRTVSAEEIVAAAGSSGVFSSITVEEVADDPRLVDIRLESPVGHTYLVMLREDLGEARVLFADYMFDDVPAHRLLRFVELLERGEVHLSFSKFGRHLVLQVPLPEGTWLDRRSTANGDLSDWAEGVLRR
ncbi:hypothetical protein ACGF07_13415 [Kitasatospora sp. NPDC048194]|uniref:hypothetical protein n=1 Tax=Kitasatospora sp. NPDC048194 TaxID=3364045 RepID=UPI003712A1DA